MNRRTVITQGITGASLGSLWAIGLSTAARSGDPTIEAIGADDAQIVLFDAGNFRALIMIGYPSKRLREHIGSLTGVFRRRIDLLTGSRAGIDAVGHEFILRHRIVRTIALDDQFAPIPSASQRIEFPLAMQAELAEDITLGIHSRTSNAWSKGGTERRTWLIEIRRGDATCCLTPSLDDIALHGPVAPAVAIAPGGSLPFSSHRLGGAAIAINADDIDERDIGGIGKSDAVYLVRIHPRDTAVFSFVAGGIRLPAWAERRTISRTS